MVVCFLTDNNATVLAEDKQRVYESRSFILVHIKFNYKMLLTCEMKNENDECQMDNERTFLSL